MTWAFSWSFLAAALVVHLLYLASVFDIYFTSPLLQGIRGVEVASNSLANRIVLIVLDGLSAERAFPAEFFSLPSSSSFLLIPLLRNRISYGGATWGIAHTRVPTESRVGHVAMIAGFYEDPAAITRGWKENPVEFDHLFNQSRHTWAFGAEDIVNIFQKGVAARRMTSLTYPSRLVDFADANPSLLDQWVHDKVVDLFASAVENHTLREHLSQDRLVFFVHLVATDTMGHNKKPGSQQYFETVRKADSVIANVSRVIADYYNDDRTAFVVTSDHGMTAWGTHGAGHSSETSCPIVAWGAGVKKSRRPISKEAEAVGSVRIDMEQVDIPVLLSTLLGTSIPVHSIGQLPLGYLNASDEFKAKAMFKNAVQMQSQYVAHENRVKSCTYMFRPFSAVDGVAGGTAYLTSIKQMISEGRFLQAMNASRELIKQSVRGIRYYHEYDRFFLSFAVNTGFAGWMLLLVIRVLENHTDLLKVSQMEARRFDLVWIRSLKFKASSWFVSLGVVLYNVHAAARLSHVAYIIFPIIVAHFVLHKHMALRKLVSVIRSIGLLKLAFVSISPLVFVALLTISFFRREALTALAFGLSIMPWLPFLLRRLNWHRGTYAFAIAWSVSTMLMGAFPLLPVVSGKENYFLVFAAGFAVTTTGATTSALMKGSHTCIIGCLSAGVFACVLIKMHTVVSISHGLGLPVVNQVLSWMSVPALPGIALVTDPTSPIRLLAVSMSLSGVYVLTSVSYEALFVVMLCFAMATWVAYEISAGEEGHTGLDARRRKPDSRLIAWRDVRHAFSFVFFVMISFFGTGNIASVNTFDNASTYCFQTVLNQWVMALVLMVKLFIPLVLVCVFFSALQGAVHAKGRGLFLVVLLITDAMGAVLFFMVKDEGSWLDIGESLSRFVICLVFVVFIIPLVELSNVISGHVVFDRAKSHSL